MTKEKNDDIAINRLIDALEKMNKTLSKNNKELISTLNSIEHDLAKIQKLIDNIYIYKL
jgi:ABC-type branched-subunit amino acid transport system ATPase component